VSILANAVKIKQTMLEQGIPAETIAQFVDLPPNGNFQAESILPLIEQMDELLTEEQRLAIMERQGCCKTGKADVEWKAFGRTHKDKPLVEKVRLICEANLPYIPPGRLNEDGALSVFWGAGKDGDYRCVCRAIKKLSPPMKVSTTYCACCGGHVRYHYQNALNVTLRLKEVVSSAASSGGEKRCEFLFDVLDGADTWELRGE
jgi:hypothetical protein